MTDLLFIEFGAVVAEVVSPSRCTVELFVDIKDAPTYRADRRVEVDFAGLLEDVIKGQGWLTLAVAAASAKYDLIPGAGSPPIGPRWPGGGYEGIVSVRADLVKVDANLSAAAARFPAHPWEYEVVVAIDGGGGLTRYHGFHAEVVGPAGAGFDLLVTDAATSMNPNPRKSKVRYDPADTKTFYAGPLVADRIVGASRKVGAVYITPEGAARMGPSLPKLPPGAGL